MNRRQLFAAMGAGSIPVLAGCTSSVSDEQPGSGGGDNSDSGAIEGVTPVAFENNIGLQISYDVEDYVEVLIENGDGRIVGERRFEPDFEQAGIFVADLSGGEYTIVFRQGGETIDTETVEFAGADPQIVDITQNWSENVLETVAVTIANEGDLPVGIYNGIVEVGDYDPWDTSIYKYAEPGGQMEIEIAEVHDGFVVDGSGTVRGDVTVESSVGDFSERFSHELEPASVEISGVEGVWNSVTLSAVDVSVQNSGGVSVEVYAEVDATPGDMVDSSTREVNPGGEDTVLTAQGTFPIYRPSGSPPEDVDLDISVYASGGRELASTSTTTSAEE